VTNFKETYVFQIHLFLRIKYAAAAATYYILKKLSPGTDQIPPELINKEGRTLRSEIHKLTHLEYGGFA
jgi:hypothetical protein